MNLRELSERNSRWTLEDYKNGFALPVILTSPDGVPQEFSANSRDPENPDLLAGQVMYDQVDLDSDGNEIIVRRPVITLRRSSLNRIPADGERWKVEIPEDPEVEASKKTYVSYRIYEDGRTLNWIRIDLIDVEQIDEF